MTKLTLALLLTAVALSGPALGGEPAPAASDEAALVSDHVKRGDAARGAARWEEAVESYRAALEAATRAGLAEGERARIATRLGSCELALGRHRDAAEHLRAAMDHLGALPPDQRASVPGSYEQAVSKVARWIVEVTPADAEVFIDDRSIGSGQPTYLVFLEPGAHTARAQLAGHSDFILAAHAAAGEVERVGLALPEVERPDAEPPAPPRPSAAPVAPAALDAAPARNETAIAMRRIGVGTTVALGGIGAGLVISAAVVHGKLNEQTERVNEAAGPNACAGGPLPPICEDMKKAQQVRDKLSGAGIVMLSAAAVVGGITLSSLWWAPSKRASTAARVVPTVDPGHAGITLMKAW